MAEPTSSGCTFYDKKLENVYVCIEQFTEDCYEVSYRYEMVGAKTRKRRLTQDAVPKIFQRSAFKATISVIKQSIENSSFAVIQEISSCHYQEVNENKANNLTAYGFIKPPFNI